MFSFPIKLFSGLFFLFNFHLALGLYINSSYLNSIDGKIFTNQTLGLVFGLAGIITIVVIQNLSFFAKKFKTIKNYLSFIIIANTALLIGLLLFINSPLIIFICFTLYQIVNTVCLYLFDLFIEEYSDNEKTGKIRGFYLTMGNIAVMLAPITAGFLLGNSNNYRSVYIIASIVIFFTYLFWLLNKNKINNIEISSTHNFLENLKNYFKGKNNNIKIAFWINFIMNFFFSWMVIYTPIYLSNQIGLSWQQIGFVFTIMLTPFILFEIPLGRIADKIKNEKLIILIGLLFISLSTIALGLINFGSVALITVILFLTRTGASALEIGSESLFFKNVSDQDYELIGIFRFARPLGYLVGPIIASFIFLFFDIKNLAILFIILGFIFIPFILKLFHANLRK